MEQTYGDWIRSLREGRGWSQSDLAAKVGRSLSLVQKHEAAEEVYGHLTTRRKLAEAFGIPFDEFEAKWRPEVAVLDVPREVYDRLAAIAEAWGLDESAAMGTVLDVMEVLLDRATVQDVAARDPASAERVVMLMAEKRARAKLTPPKPKSRESKPPGSNQASA